MVREALDMANLSQELAYQIKRSNDHLLDRYQETHYPKRIEFAHN